MDFVYLACGECKVGLRIEMEANLSTRNAERDAFLGDHLRHNGFETVPEEQFTFEYLARGYKDLERPEIEPVPAPPHSNAPPSLSLGGRVAPFSAPNQTQNAAELKRPSWDEYFLRIAEVIAQRGTCSRLQVGAVLVKEKKIIATGYNGAPAGLRHCDHRNDGDMENGHCSVAEHAERNALLTCEVNKANATLYVTATPCPQCMRNAITVGIKRVVYRAEYRPTEAVFRMCQQAGIDLISKSRE